LPSIAVTISVIEIQQLRLSRMTVTAEIKTGSCT
jgi:hypothetical protein